MANRIRALSGMVLMLIAATAGATQTGVCAAAVKHCYLFSDTSAGYGNALVVFDAGEWTSSFFNGTFGEAGDTPVIGDWNGDGKPEVGVYRDGYWHMRMRQPDGTFAVTTIYYGSSSPLVTPVVGDWNGDGKDSIGVVLGIRWVLKPNVNEDSPSSIIDFGTATSRPLVGDWNGDGIDTVAFVDNGWMHYRNTNAYDDADTGTMKLPPVTAHPGYQPVAWNVPWAGDTELILDVIAFINPEDRFCAGPCNGDGAVVVVPGPGHRW